MFLEVHRSSGLEKSRVPGIRPLPEMDCPAEIGLEAQKGK